MLVKTPEYLNISDSSILSVEYSPDGTFITMNEDAALTRFVSCYKAGNPNQGEDQTIRGIKSFVDGILPYSSSVDLGSSPKPFNNVWATNGLFTNLRTVSLSGEGDSIALSASLIPPTESQINLGSESDPFYQAYLNNLKVGNLLGINHEFTNDFNIPVGCMIYGELIIEGKIRLEMCEEDAVPGQFLLRQTFPLQYGKSEPPSGYTADFLSENFFLFTPESQLRHRERVHIDDYDDEVVEGGAKIKFIAHLGRDQFLYNPAPDEGLPLKPSSTSEYSIYLIKEHYYGTSLTPQSQGTTGDYEVSVDTSDPQVSIDYYNGVTSGIANVILSDYYYDSGFGSVVTIQQKFWCVLVRTK